MHKRRKTAPYERGGLNLNFFGIALAAGAGFLIAGAAHLDFGESAVAALEVVLAGCNVASYAGVYVFFHTYLR